MPAVLGALVAMFLCGVALFVCGVYAVTGNHGGTVLNTAPFWVPALWGFASAVAVLARRRWARTSFLAWGTLTTLALLAGLAGGWADGATPMVFAILVVASCLAVGWVPRAAR